MNYRGQSHDKAANMPGLYSGLQVRLTEQNIYTLYAVLEVGQDEA
jgi:hypothetical protein